MREIKFRAWDDTLLRYLEPLTIEQIAKGNFKGTNWYQLTLEQFTGLHDKNGVEVYEGDFVKTHYANSKNSEFTEVVVFHNGKFVTYLESNGCKSWSNIFDGVEHLYIDKSVYMDSIEVIGNIHEENEK